MKSASLKLYLFASLFLLAAGLSYGQATFTVEVGATRVAVGERLRVAFVLEGARGSAFEAPTLEGLRIVGGPSTSSQYTIVNGSTSQSERITYELRCEREGALQIGPASVRANGNVLTTKPVELLGTPRETLQTNAELDDAQPAMLRVKPRKDTLYEGEATTLDLDLLSLKRVYTYRVIEPLALQGLRVEALQRSNNRQVPVEVDGKPAMRSTLQRNYILADRPGSYPMQQAQLRVSIVAGDGRRRGLFGSPSTRDYIVASQPDTINVLPLPAGAPDDFCGLVGRWTFQGVYEDMQALTTAEAVTFKLYVHGEGDVNRLRTPDLQWPKGWRAYPPEIILDRVVETDTGVVYTRAYEFVVAPSTPGQHILQPSLSYFDVDQEQYYTWQAPARTVNVTAAVGGAGAGAVVQAPGNAEAALSRSDERPRIVSSSFWSRWWAWPLFAIGPLGILLVYAWPHVQARFRGTHEVAALDPLAEGRRRLAAARKQLDDPQAFYREVRTALEKYAEERLGLQASTQQELAIRAAFAKTDEESKAQRFLEARALADRGLYGGGTDAAGRQAALRDLEELLA